MSTLLGRASLRREVFRQAWPLVLLNLCRTMMFFVDALMIGRVGTAAMASMSIVGPVAYTAGALLAALSVGTVATVARAWGEGDREKQEGEAATAAALGLAVGLPLSLLGLAALPRLARLFAVSDAPEIVPMAEGYLFWEGGAFLFLCLDLAASGILRGAGQTRVALAAALVANGVNIALNWVFIYGNLAAPRLGVEGAGIATASAQAVEGLITFGFLWTPWSPIRLRLASFGRVTRDSVSRLVRVTLPALVEPAILQSGFLVYTKAIASLGLVALAAHRAALSVESLSFMAAHGFATAGGAIVGQQLGARRPDLADAALREAARLSTWVMSGLGVLFVLAATPIVRLFLPGPGNEEVIALAALCLVIAGVDQPFMALGMALGGGLRGAGDTRSPVVVAVIGVWMIRVPLAWALAFPAGLGLAGIWITMIVDWSVRTLVFSVLFRRGRWKTIKL